MPTNLFDDSRLNYVNEELIFYCYEFVYIKVIRGYSSSEAWIPGILTISSTLFTLENEFYLLE